MEPGRIICWATGIILGVSIPTAGLYSNYTKYSEVPSVKENLSEKTVLMKRKCGFLGGLELSMNKQDEATPEKTTSLVYEYFGGSTEYDDFDSDGRVDSIAELEFEWPFKRVTKITLRDALNKSVFDSADYRLKSEIEILEAVYSLNNFD